MSGKWLVAISWSTRRKKASGKDHGRPFLFPGAGGRKGGFSEMVAVSPYLCPYSCWGKKKGASEDGSFFFLRRSLIRKRELRERPVFLLFLRAWGNF